MKTIPSLSCLLVALSLMAHFSPLAAQYNPPPPPDQSNTGGGPPEQQDMGQVPPPDQGQSGPDDSVPPPDADQGDQGAPGQGDSGGDVNFQTFYNDLGSQGNWVQTGDYGYVFQPNEEDPDWAPYTDGHWVYTDEGWTWVAGESEPFGWATYHYGRWANLDGYGWVWVPGYTWAPAWVSWRYGDGYCGWAPLPPATFVGIDVGDAGFDFHIGGDCDTAFGIGPAYYNFIPVGYLGARDYRHHFANRNNNFVIINNTRNVTNIVVNNRRGSGRFGRVNVGGPSIATVNAQSSTPVQRVRLERGNRPGNSSLNGNRLSVFAPRVNSAGGTNLRPGRVSGNFANTRINNGTNISQPMMVNSRVRRAAASNEQIAAARNVHFSDGSRVATPETHPTAALTKPLSSFTPRNEGPQRADRPGQQNASVNANANRQDAAFTGRNGNDVRHQTNNPQVQQNVAAPQAQAQVQQTQINQHTQQADRQAQRAQQQAQRQQLQQVQGNQQAQQTQQADRQAQREQQQAQRQQQAAAVNQQSQQTQQANAQAQRTQQTQQTQQADRQAQREQQQAQRQQQQAQGSQQANQTQQAARQAQHEQQQAQHQQQQQHEQHQESHPQAQPQQHQNAPQPKQGGNGGSNHPANDGKKSDDKNAHP